VGTKLCLSISQHHPEHWQPSWSVRTALMALIAFMPSAPDGAIGGLNYPPDERRSLAALSRKAPPKVVRESLPLPSPSPPATAPNLVSRGYREKLSGRYARVERTVLVRYAL
jgi:hypothetical protein